MGTPVSLNNALCLGYERMAAWADLLDQINVFPIADADTGTNLKISLAPLRIPTTDPEIQKRRLLMAATGNSGNIASAFFCELVKANTLDDLQQHISRGQMEARKAVIDPKPGTMLTVFDVLNQCMGKSIWNESTQNGSMIVKRLEKAVAETTDMLPVLQQAGVVDAGALGMFILLETFFCTLSDPTRIMRPVTEIFPEKLAIAKDWQPSNKDQDYCVNTMIQTDSSVQDVQDALSGSGESIVVTAGTDYVKVHMHTRDKEAIHDRLSSMGKVTAWSDESMETRVMPRIKPGATHIMTDAAGSLTLDDARDLRVTLLNSYLVVDGRAWPETLFEPQELYSAMSRGGKVTTAQASVFERQQSYLSATQMYSDILYLCVGSVYTGNYETAVAWQIQQGFQDRFTVLDTGAASGRLGIITRAVARFAQTCIQPDIVRQYADSAIAQSQEFVFLDQLKYLAAGGRISKTKGFFGDLMGMKPIVSPRPEGAVKVGVVRNRRDQLTFALEQLDRGLKKEAPGSILIEYSDNRNWVEGTAAEQIRNRFPETEILICPLSLTSGAHMGPGTWAIAFLPSITPPDTVPTQK